MILLRLSDRLGDQPGKHRYRFCPLLVVEYVPHWRGAFGYRRFEKTQLLHVEAPAVSAAAGHPQPIVDAAEHPQPSGPGATARRRPAMPAKLVLSALSGLSDQSRRLESGSAFHRVIPTSNEACRPGEPSPAHPAPGPRRHGAYGRWLLAQDIQRGGGGGQSIVWFFDRISHPWLNDHRDASGKATCLDLFQATSVPIIRHIKIQAQATPYDPAFTDYFARRAQSRRVSRLRWRGMVVSA